MSRVVFNIYHTSTLTPTKKDHERYFTIRRGHKSPQEAVCPVRNSQQLQTWFRGDNRGEDDWEVTVQKTSMEEVSVDSATASVGTKLGGILCREKSKERQ